MAARVAVVLSLLVASLASAQSATSSSYAHRFRFFVSDPAVCAKGSVGFNYTTNLAKLCNPANTWSAFTVGGITQAAADSRYLQLAGGTMTGSALGKAGTAGSVAWGFVGEADTGMFLSAANAIGFATGGTERWVINASGALNCATDGGCDIGNGAADPRDISLKRNLLLRPVLFAALGTPADGAMTYCSDCTAASPTAGGGTGAVVKRENGAWNAGGGAAGIGGSSGSVDNAVLRADGTGGATIQSSDLAVSDASASNVTISTSAGNALTVAPTAPAQAAGSQAGKSVIITPSAAVDGSSTHAAALGGFLVLNVGAAVNGGTAGQVQIPAAGTASAPAFCISATPGSLCQLGLMSTGFGMSVTNGGSKTVDFSFGRVMLGSTGQLSIASDSVTDNADTRLTRCGAACWQMGDAASSTPVNQQLSAQWASGTDIAGAKFTGSPGKGTGSGAPGDYDIQTSFPLGSGTTAQSFADRLYIRGNPKTLVDATPTAIADIAVASNTITGGTLQYTIEAIEGANRQALRGTVEFSAVNEGGTETCLLSTPVEIEVSPTGTLTNAVTCTTAGSNAITLNLNADTSLTPTTFRVTWKLSLDGGTGVVSPL